MGTLNLRLCGLLLGLLFCGCASPSKLPETDLLRVHSRFLFLPMESKLRVFEQGGRLYVENSLSRKARTEVPDASAAELRRQIAGIRIRQEDIDRVAALPSKLDESQQREAAVFGLFASAEVRITIMDSPDPRKLYIPNPVSLMMKGASEETAPVIELAAFILKLATLDSATSAFNR